MSEEKTLFDGLVKREQADDMAMTVDFDKIIVEDWIQPSQSLIDSIREYGVLQPVLLRPAGDMYYVVDGRRRVMACKQLGIRGVPAYIRRNAKGADGWALSIITQVERSDNTLSEGKAIRELVAAGATQAQIMERLHLTKERYEKMLALSALPDEVLSAVEQGKVAPTTAQKVAKLPEVYRKDALDKFEQEGKLTGRDVDEVKQVRKEKAVEETLGEVIIPIPKTPVEIASSLLLEMPGTDRELGWNEALETLINELERM